MTAAVGNVDGKSSTIVRIAICSTIDKWKKAEAYGRTVEIRVRESIP